MRTCAFTLPLSCQPSLNEWRRWHWSKRSRHQTAVARDVGFRVLIARRSAKGPRMQPPMEKARVTATFHFPTKARRDPSNYSLKFVADALVTNGVIVDDDFTHMEEIVRVGEVDKEGRIDILVEEIAEEGSA